MYTIYKRIFPDKRVYIGCTSKSVEMRLGTDGLGYASSPFFSEYTAEDWNSVVTEIISQVEDAIAASRAEAQAIQDFLDNHPRSQLLNSQLESHYSWNTSHKQTLGDRLRESKTFQQAARDPEHHKKIAESITRKWKDPGYREKVITSLRNSPKKKMADQDPIHRQRMSQAAKAMHADPEKHAAFLRVQRSEERRQKLSVAIRSSQKHKESCQSAERNEKLSQSLKAYYAQPGAKEAMGERLKQSQRFQDAMKSPERREKISKAFKGRKAIHKGEERKLVNPEELANYLAQGWELGYGSMKKTSQSD